MSIIRSISVVALTLLLSSSAAAARAIILVRHAEKEPDGSPDPRLSIAGEDRAIALTRFLRNNNIDAIFVTELRRTQETAAVCARQRGLSPVVVKADDTQGVVAKLRSLPADAVVLVVGHSNTLPEILAALGVREKVSIRDDEYGRVFVVTPSSDPAHPGLLEFRY